MTDTTVRWLYGDEAVDIAESRGWDPTEHNVALSMTEDATMTVGALVVGRDDALGLTHPLNLLTEEEMLRWERTRP